MNARRILLHAISAVASIVLPLAMAHGEGTIYVRHAPSITGTVEGSVRQVLPESATLGGSARLTGDWLVPGTPTLRVNGAAKNGATFDGSGAADPTDYQIALGGAATLGRLGRRTPSLTLPSVNAPAGPAGTRSVVLTPANLSVGDWATVRDLNANSIPGLVSVPSGSYGTFVAHGGGFILGVAGGAAPVRYSFERLVLDGAAEVRLAGPVIITLGEGLATNGIVGASSNPGWLQLRVVSGGLTLNGNGAFYGVVVAPTGTVTLAGTSQLTGQTISDGLQVAGGATLRALSFAQPLPYLADFEADEGYTPGSLLGQQGWSISQGSATISAGAAFSGVNSVLIPSGAPPGRILQTFIPLVGESIVFVDFVAKPGVDPSIANSSVFDVDNARLAFRRMDTAAVLHAFNGDGAGGGNWVPTQFTAALGSDLQLQAWVRVTARLDFIKKQWDLYAAGRMVAADVKFRDSAAGALAWFAVQGDTAADTRVDYLLAGPDNPLFVDADKDGLDDAWELRYGLNPTVNDRYAMPAGNGVPVVQAYINGTDPNDYYQGLAPNITVVVGADGPLGAEGLVSVRVTNAEGAVLPNAPVKVSLSTAASRLSAFLGGAPVTGPLSLRTDPQGIATFYLTFTTYKSEILTVVGGLRTISFTIQPPKTDMDGNGLPDLWEITYFGRTGIDVSADTDGDGISNLQESKNGSNPADYYNGVLPVMTSQVGTDGELAPDGSLQLKVTNTAGTPLVNAPVTFNVKQGGHHLSATADGPPVDQIAVRTDANGTAKVFILAGSN